MEAAGPAGGKTYVNLRRKNGPDAVIPVCRIVQDVTWYRCRQRLRKKTYTIR